MKILLRRVVAALLRGYAARTHVHRLLASEVTPAGAIAAVRKRVAQREQSFLHTLEQAVFAHPSSPYRPLFEAAGYNFDAIKPLVGAVGIEGTLRALRDRGVYVTVQEFKGIQEARRGEQDVPLHSRGV